ncbi:MAG: mandelate racemase/muconate lactonizing enzyme family protein, partial [Acidimicrobiaceae bacterium]
MKIEKLQTFVVGNPPPRTGGRYFIFVKLTTDTGVTGIGEIYTATYSPQVVCKVAEDIFARYVFGSDPFHIEKMWRRTYGSGFSHRPDFSTAGVVSGLEMAMWDICGKDTGKPVYELLGGQVHDRLRCYTYLYPPHEFDAHSDHPLYSDPDMSAEAALREVERGFTAVKLDPAGPYSVYDGRQPSLATIDRSVRMVA